MQIQVVPTPAGRDLTSEAVLTECKDAAFTTREISDQVARVIATYYQSPGTVGHVLATLASGLPVDRDEFLRDISNTVAECYGDDADGDLMLDMLGTWALNYGR